MKLSTTSLAKDDKQPMVSVLEFLILPKDT